MIPTETTKSAEERGVEIPTFEVGQWVGWLPDNGNLEGQTTYPWTITKITPDRIEMKRDSQPGFTRCAKSKDVMGWDDFLQLRERQKQEIDAEREIERKAHREWLLLLLSEARTEKKAREAGSAAQP